MRVQDTNEWVDHNGTRVINISMSFMSILTSRVFLVSISSVFKIIIISPFSKAPICVLCFLLLLNNGGCII